MARKNAKEIRRGQNRVKDYKPKGRKRPAGWHKRKWLPIRKLMREFKSGGEKEMQCRTCLRGTLINEPDQLYSCTERGGLRVLGESYKNYQHRSLVKAADHVDCQGYVSRAYYEEDWTEELEHDD